MMNSDQKASEDSKLNCGTASSSIDKNQIWPLYKLNETNDDKAPVHFESLILNTILDRWRMNECKASSFNDYPLECDLLCCVVLVISLEEGFRLNERQTTTGFDIRVLRALKQMPSSRMTNNIYRVNVTFPSCVDVQFAIIVIPTAGDICIVNFIAIEKNTSTRTVEVSCSYSAPAIYLPRYVTVYSQTCVRFHNLRKLTLLIRPIFEEAVKRVFSDHNFVAPGSFMLLPEEVKMHLFRFLEAKDFVSLTSTNYHLNNRFARNNEIWRYYLRRDMKIGEIVGVNPLQAYKTWFRRAPPEGRRTNQAGQATMTPQSSSRPVRSISELSHTSTPTTASQRSQPRSSGSEWEYYMQHL